MRFAVARGLPRSFRWLMGGMLVMTGASFVVPFLTLFMVSRGYSVATAGLILSLFGVGGLPAGPVGGFLADRYGRRPALVGSLVLAGALAASLPWLSSLPMLALSALAMGFAFHAWWPPSSAMVADIVPADRYADAYGLLHWIRNAGYAVSYAVGGMLAAGGYTRLFLADAATTLLFAILVVFRLPETRPADHADRPAHGGYRELIADRPFMIVLALTLLVGIALFQFMTTLPVTMSRQGLGPEIYGRVMAVNGLLILLFQPYLSAQARRFNRTRVLALAALLIGAGNGSYALARGAWAHAAATAVWTLGEILMVPVLSALVADLSPPHLRGRYQGALGLAFGLSLALAPILGGAVLDAAGPTALWTGCATVGGLAAAGHLAAGYRRPAAATAPSA